MAHNIYVPPEIFSGPNKIVTLQAGGETDATTSTSNRYNFSKVISSTDKTIAMLGVGFESAKSTNDERIPSLAALLSPLGSSTTVDVFELDMTAAATSHEMLMTSAKVTTSNVYAGDVLNTMWASLLSGSWNTYSPPTMPTLVTLRSVAITQATIATAPTLTSAGGTGYASIALASGATPVWGPVPGSYDVIVTTRAVAYPSKYFSPTNRDLILLWLFNMMKVSGRLIIDSGTSWNSLTSSFRVKQLSPKTSASKYTWRGSTCLMQKVTGEKNSDLIKITKPAGATRTSWSRFSAVLNADGSYDAGATQAVGALVPICVL
jgi:hypothetical protein